MNPKNPTLSRRDIIKAVSLLSLAPLLDRWPRLPDTRRPARSASTVDAPNILILVFDTLSAPHTSLFDYPRETTPNLERFADRSIVYHAHYAGGNFTTPGTASLLTSTYPWTHRAFNHNSTTVQRYRDQNLFSAFSDGSYTRIAYSHNLLANSLLRQFSQEVDVHLPPRTFSLFDGAVASRLFPGDADVASRAIEDFMFAQEHPPGSLFLSLADRIRRRLQKPRSIGPYADSYPRGVPELFKLYFVLEEVVAGIYDTITAARHPFLAYFHVLPPHEPYKPRREFVGRFEDDWQPVEKEQYPVLSPVPQDELIRLRREYDEYLAYTDAEFGRLLTLLEESGRLDDTIVVVTSDHGQLFERGIHGHFTRVLFEPLIHVPLLISLPGQQQRKDVSIPTSCIDLLPTLLYLTGRDVPEWCEGHVLPGFDATRERQGDPVFAVEAKENPKYTPLTTASTTMIRGQYKLTHYFGYGNGESVYELYDLANDPQEQTNLYERETSLAAEMRTMLEEKTAAADRPYLS